MGDSFGWFAELARRARRTAYHSGVVGVVSRYGLAIAAVLAATAVRIAFNPILGMRAPYLGFTLAVVVAAWLGGRGPGLAATVLSALSVAWFFLEPSRSFVIFDPFAKWGLAFFVAIGAFISFVAGDLRQSLRARAEAEESMRQSEERLRLAVSGADLGIWTANIETGELAASDRCLELFGVDRGRATTYRRLLAAVHPEDRDTVERAVRRAIEEGVDFQARVRVAWPDGSVHWLASRGRVYRDERGRPVRMAGTALDIDLIMKAEKELRQSVDRESARAAELQATMDAMPVAMVIARDPDCRRVIGNRRAYELFRLPPGSVIAESEPEAAGLAANRMRKDGSEIPPRELPVRKAAATGETIHDYELELVLPDGTRRDVICDAIPLLDAGGRPRGAVGVFADVTERKRAQERQREVQKMESIGRLAGGVAHDFNNLLTVIMGGASSVLLDHPDSKPLKDVIAASERAAGLTRQLLAYAGKGQFAVATFNLSDLVFKSAQLLSVSVPKKVELVFHLSGERLLVRADPTQIEQVLLNLVINAGEAIPPRTGGRIEISTRGCDVTPAVAARHGQASDVQPGRFVCLEVRDNGSGMDEETLSRLFDPFFSTKFTGRGLGLAAVHGIVRALKGFIEIQSSPGAGSTFQVFLPAAGGPAPAESPAPPRRAAPPRLQEHGRGVVLVVEDEELVRNCATAVLRRRGYEVLEARDGKEALAVLTGAASPPVLALVDLAMPAMGGDEMVPVLNRSYPGMKIVVTSGYSEEDAREAFTAGAVAGFLQKPYTAIALCDKVAEVLAAPLPC